jgi:uncharacterized protein with FMN-binding domain
MKDWKKKIHALACLLPAAVVFMCLFLSLRAYVKPTFRAEAISAEEMEELERTGSAAEKPTETAKPKSKPKVNLKKTVVLPAASESQKTSKSKSKSTKTAAKTKNFKTEGYQDGIYYGTGTGFQGDIKVKVTIKKGKITDMEIVKSQDGASYLERASALLSKMIKKQSTDVDVVSGATYSSNGLIDAVSSALRKAEKKRKKSDKKSKKNTEKVTSDKEKTEDKKNDENEMPKATDSETNFPSQTAVPTWTPLPSQAEEISVTENPVMFVYANGTYRASTVCNPNVYADFDAYTLSLKITMENDRITSVTDVKGSGDWYDSSNDWYIKRAVEGTSKYPGVAGQIVSKGTCEDIDAVSGATCSSKAIIEAVKKALESAKNG